jgi:hypothetical protein
MRSPDLPHVVDVPALGRGLARKRAMYDFHVRLGITAHPVRWQNKDGSSCIHWCFANFTNAERFARQFGGLIASEQASRFC